MPRGYQDDSSHEHAECIKLKSLIAKTSLPKSIWLEGEILERIVTYSIGCASLLAFGNAARE